MLYQLNVPLIGVFMVEKYQQPSDEKILTVDRGEYTLWVGRWCFMYIPD